MNVKITARGYKAPEHLKQYIEAKLDKKQRLFDDVMDDATAEYEP